MINGITFDECLITSSDFAHYMYTMLSKTNGITKGCEMTWSTQNVYIGKGCFVQAGRMIQIVGTEQIVSPVVQSGQLYCKVVFEIDLSKTNTTDSFNQGYFKTLTGTESYPEVIQEDLDDEGTIFQIPWCQYIKNIQGITEFKDIRKVLDIGRERVLLWENSNPSSMFASQSLSLPTLKNYDGFEIVYLADYLDIGYKTTGFLPYVDIGMYFSLDNISGDGTPALQKRVGYITNSGLLFKAGNYCSMGKATMAENNLICIPYRIYGIKNINGLR